MKLNMVIDSSANFLKHFCAEKYKSYRTDLFWDGESEQH